MMPQFLANDVWPNVIDTGTPTTLTRTTDADATDLGRSGVVYGEMATKRGAFYDSWAVAQCFGSMNGDIQQNSVYDSIPN